MAEFAYDAIDAQGVLTRASSAHRTFECTRAAPDALGPSAQRRRAARPRRGRLAKHVQEGRSPSRSRSRRQLATMIEAGVSVVAAFVTLEDQTMTVAEEIVAEVRRTCRVRMTSRATRRHRRVFDRLLVHRWSRRVKSSGTFDIVLDRVATQIEKATKLKRRCRRPRSYPAVVLSFASLVFIFMLMFIVSVFQKVFASWNGRCRRRRSHHRDVARAPRVLVHHLPDGRSLTIRFGAQADARGHESAGIASSSACR